MIKNKTIEQVRWWDTIASVWKSCRNQWMQEILSKIKQEHNNDGEPFFLVNSDFTNNNKTHTQHTLHFWKDEIHLIFNLPDNCSEIFTIFTRLVIWDIKMN